MSVKFSRRAFLQGSAATAGLMAMNVCSASAASPVEAENCFAKKSSTVKVGAEVLLESSYWKRYLKGKNVALFTNQICVDAQMNHLADKLVADPDINLVCLFGGEHGLRGAYQAGAAVPHCIDATTGLINWSLYNGGTIDTEALGVAALAESMENPKNPGRPTRAMFTGNNGAWYAPIDVVLFDLQEIGSKTWTYLYNLADLMAACIEAKKYYGHEVELIVLDRPSSISSEIVEGSITTSNNQTGFGRFPFPSRYGLTMGEVAKMYHGEGWKYYWQKTYPGGPDDLYGSTTSMPSKTYHGEWAWDDEAFKDKLSLADCPVKVIPCEGYTRDMYWDETGLQFILPSPNMPTVEACLIYTGTVWFEGLPINEGRGTTKPFEIITAPYVDGEALAARMNGMGLKGVTFRPASTTTLSTNQLLAGTNYVGTLAHGIQIHVTDKRAFSPIKMQVALCLVLQAMYGATTDEEKKDGEHFYAHYQLDYRAGADWVSSTIQNFPVGASDEQIKATSDEMLARMDEELKPYLKMRKKYLMSDYNVSVFKKKANTLQPQITLGCENFLKDAAKYKGVKIGLVTNQSGVDSKLEHLADLFAKNADITLTTLFSTGLGLRGEFQTAEAGEYVDEKTGLTVCRLNGNEPTAEQLANVELLLFDIQDTGSRCNSVAQVMMDCIKAASAAGKRFAVLDRPNPLGGNAVEGPVDGTYALPTRYGMTAGEMAMYFAKKLGVNNVTVVKMSDWDREMFYDETGLQFVQTDRKIATPTTLLTYAGIGWLEGTTTWDEDVANQTGVSYGWGTTKTYEFFGAPFMKADMVAFANTLNELELPGVRFRLAAMTPWNNKTELAEISYPGTACYGVQMHIMDEHSYNAVETILNILAVMNEYFGDDMTYTDQMAQITGSESVAQAIASGKSAEEICAGFQSGLNAFKAERESVLLY